MSDDREKKINSELEKFSELAAEAQEELKKLCDDMLNIAKDVKDEYDDIDDETIDAISGSITQIHEDSPYLDEFFEGEQWKKVIKKMPDLDLSKLKIKPTKKKEDDDVKEK